MLGNMESTAKDELKINTSKLNDDRPISRQKTNEEMKESTYIKQEITNYDEMLKDFILSIDETCEAILENLKFQDYTLVAYNIGILHKEASSAIEQFGIGHLFKEEIEGKE